MENIYERKVDLMRGYLETEKIVRMVGFLKEHGKSFAGSGGGPSIDSVPTENGGYQSMTYFLPSIDSVASVYIEKECTKQDTGAQIIMIGNKNNKEVIDGFLEKLILTMHT